MIGFSYIYKSSEEILGSVSHLGSMNIIDIGLTILVVCLVLLCGFVIFPSIIIIHEYNEQQREKIRKKKLLKQILLQKEIEDEVEKEIEIEGEKEVI